MNLNNRSYNEPCKFTVGIKWVQVKQPAHSKCSLSINDKLNQFSWCCNSRLWNSWNSWPGFESRNHWTTTSKWKSLCSRWAGKSKTTHQHPEFILNEPAAETGRASYDDYGSTRHPLLERCGRERSVQKVLPFLHTLMPFPFSPTLTLPSWPLSSIQHWAGYLPLSKGPYWINNQMELNFARWHPYKDQAHERREGEHSGITG